MTKTLHIFILVCLILFGCTPPRSGSTKKKSMSNIQKEGKKEKPDNSNSLSGNSDISKNILNEKLKKEEVNITPKDTIKNTIDSVKTLSNNLENNKNINRDIDTNYIYLDTINIQKNNLFETKNEINFDKEFDKAVIDFDKEKYSDACSKFDIFNSTLPYNDSLYFESAFYKSECLITNNRLQEAENILKYLSTNNTINKNTLERVILRLGQVYCAQGKKGLAEKYFSMFKKEFSNSIFYKLATCDVVK